MKNNDNEWKCEWCITCAVVIIALIVMFAISCPPKRVHGSDLRWSINVTDFSKPMVPTIAPDAVNDPSLIAFSKNMYSLRAGGRQLRTGITAITSQSAAAGAGKSVLLYAPSEDSSAVIFTGSGKWWYSVAGTFQYINPEIQYWKSTLDTNLEIRPYPSATQIQGYNGEDTLILTNGRAMRDFAPGDSIFDTAGTYIGTVRCPLGDEKLKLVAAMSKDTTITAYYVSRSYDSTSSPFLLQALDYAYTGTVATKPQVIYTDENDTLRMRQLGIVDSFVVDTVGFKYIEDSTRYSYDSLVGTTKYMIHEAMFVSRRAGWEPGQWKLDAQGNPATYYLAVGHYFDDSKVSKTRYYPIMNNNDSAIIVQTWYVDTLIAGTKEWSDSIFLDLGSRFTPNLEDTLHDSLVIGDWAYIVSSAGDYRVCINDGNSPTATLLGRGAVWLLTGSDASIISPDSFLTGLYYLHFTRNDVTFPSYKQYPYSTYSFNQDWWIGLGQPEPAVPGVPSGDEITNIGPWRDVTSGYITHYQRTITVVTSRNTVKEEYATASKGFYPVRYAFFVDSSGTANDSLFIVTGVSNALSDTSQVTTANWELVKVEMPNFVGMEESFRTLYAYGDSLSPGTIFSSGPAVPGGAGHWSWVGTRDVTIGSASDPIRAMLGWDDQLVVWKLGSFYGYDGNQFTELSKTYGCVGPRAVCANDKEVFWLDVSGPKRMQRGQFRAYENQPIDAGMKSVFNSWSANIYGTNVVPTRLNPAARGRSVFINNPRDHHLYLIYAEHGSDTPNRTLTYNLDARAWDGYFTVGANDAAWMTVRDTARIVLAMNDSTFIMGMDYIYYDALSTSTGIDADLYSHYFWKADELGHPMFSRLVGGVLEYTFTGAGVTTAYVMVSSDSTTAMVDTFNIAPTSGGLPKRQRMSFYSGKNLVGTKFQWELTTDAADTTGSSSLFMPEQLILDFEPIRRVR